MPARAIDPPIEMMTHVPRYYAVALWKNVMITYFAKQATLPALRDLGTQWNIMSGRHSRFSHIGLIDGGAGLPDGETRLALRDLHDQHATSTVCVAVILMGTGFWASALQGMVTNIRQLATRKRTSELRTARAAAELRDWFVSTHSAKTGLAISGDDYDGMIAALLAEARVI